MIDIHNPADITYWVQVLNTTHEELLVAVAKVGASPDRVREYLSRGSSAQAPGTPEQLPDGG